MTQEIFVKPAAGARVRHETLGRPIKATGERVGRTTYIRRRINDGDLEETEHKPKSPPSNKGAG